MDDNDPDLEQARRKEDGDAGAGMRVFGWFGVIIGFACLIWFRDGRGVGAALIAFVESAVCFFESHRLNRERSGLPARWPIIEGTIDLIYLRWLFRQRSFYPKPIDGAVIREIIDQLFQRHLYRPRDARSAAEWITSRLNGRRRSPWWFDDMLERRGITYPEPVADEKTLKNG